MKKKSTISKSGLLALLLLGTAQQASALVIDEFRVRGPNGAADEYIRLFNDSAVPLTVNASDASAGYSVAASDGIVRCVIPNGTVIPARGHYLCVNSTAYALGSYPAGNGTTATGDATFTTNLLDNAGIALFSTSDPANFDLTTRLDAVGSTAEANTLYKEGTGYPALTPFSIDYTFTRDTCGKAGSITTMGTCPAGGLPSDTNNNAADFIFVDTNGTSAGAGQRLGSPGPANLSSPIVGTMGMSNAELDSCTGVHSAPNVVRDFTSDPANNSTFGTLDIRRTFTNTTGAAITRLRFRVIDLTTFPAPSGFADLRPRTSTPVVVTVDRAPCGSATSNVTVQGTLLEQPPSQPNGGGFNSTFSANTVTLATPLAVGDSIDLRFLMGIQQTGRYKLGLIAETLPDASTLFEINGCTDGLCPPSVTSITRASTNPTTAGTVQYTVIFDQPVTGVDAADFTLTTTGAIAGASITSVTGSGTTYTVTVNTGTGVGSGTLRLNVVDNDSIINASSQPLGDTGNGNGNFTGGEVYTANLTTPPAVVSIVRADADPTTATSVNYTVTFDQSVTGVDAADFALTATGGLSGTSITSVTGSGATYTVTASTGSASVNGTLRLDLVDDDSIVNGGSRPLGGTGAGNGSFATGEVYAVNRYVAPPPAPAPETPATPPCVDTSSLPGNYTVLPCVLNFNTNQGTTLTNGIANTLSAGLGLGNVTLQPQNGSGAVTVQAVGSTLAFVPLSTSTNDPRVDGIYPATNGRYVIVSGGNAVTVAPAVINLPQLVSQLPGSSLVADEQGILSATLDGTTYVVQPSFFVEPGAGQATPLVVIGNDGRPRLTDSAGNTQVLNPAFLEPNTVANILAALDSQSTNSVQLDGTVAITLGGQTLTLVPDLTLGGVPQEHVNDSFWQEGPNRYRLRNLNRAGTSQGFTVR